jgi:DNA polymerase III delta prime subunit
LQSLNFKLENESQSPFHAYLLLSDSSKYVLDQSVQFASTISLSQNYDQDHPDIRVIESENINTIGIEDVRDVLNRDNLSPIAGKYKVIIFPPYKSLTEEASNALLKTLEEPSSSSIFILTSTGNFWSHAKDDANTGIINTIKSRCRTVFVESETATSYDFTFDDFSNFVDIRDFISKVDRDKVNSLLKILEKLIKIESTSSKNMYKFQALLKNVKNIQLEFEETTATFKNKLTTRSLEYVVRAVLTGNRIDKLNYRYCELIQRAIEEIQQGMRDSIVLNNLSVELGEL